MQHSLFDRIYLAFLMILIISFVVLIIFVSYFTRRSLISEKTETLSNEASLIATQAVAGYMSGEMDSVDLADYFNYYSQTLQSDIWFVSDKGFLIANSTYYAEGPSNSYKSALSANDKIPNNIYQLDRDYVLDKKHSQVGDFYGLYGADVISVNVPLEFTDEETGASVSVGALILHSSTGQINNMMRSIYSISYVPCLVIIAIAFAFLSIISTKIIRPIKKLSNVAQEYSKGDFEVKTEITSKDEIGQLAESMEYMASQLGQMEEYRHEFISNISHDFRSPLTSIRGYIQAMLDGTIPPEKQERYLNICLDETNRLTKLTQGLLDLNSLEIYGPYLKLEDFDFIDIVKPTLNTFEIKCIDKGVAIYLNNHATNTMVTADKTKIQQVVYNLIDNALKFTPSGKQIFVTINDKSNKLIVSVKDEGIGMDQDTQKRIWTRFYKGDASRGKDKQGTGLGLAITKEIIKAHNENIEVISTPDVGSEFVFTLTKAAQMAPHTGQTEVLINNTNRPLHLK